MEQRQRFFHLVAQHQVVCQTLLQPRIVGLHFHGFLESLGGALVIVHLLVGLTERDQGALVGISVGSRLELLDGALVIAEVGVQAGESGEGFLIVRIGFHGLVVRLLGVYGIIGHAI